MSSSQNSKFYDDGEERLLTALVETHANRQKQSERHSKVQKRGSVDVKSSRRERGRVMIQECS